MTLRLNLFLFPWELESMDEYSCSLPTGTTVGKIWKRNLTAFQRSQGRVLEPEWIVCMYAEHEDPNKVRILTFNVELKQGPRPRSYRAPDWSNYQQWQKDRAEERLKESRQ